MYRRRGNEGWCFGSVKTLGTTLKTAVIKWDSDAHNLLPASVSQAEVKRLVSDAEVHQEHDAGRMAASAAKRPLSASEVGRPPAGWLPPAWIVWNKHGPEGTKPAPLFFWRGAVDWRPARRLLEEQPAFLLARPAARRQDDRGRQPARAEAGAARRLGRVEQHDWPRDGCAQRPGAADDASPRPRRSSTCRTPAGKRTRPRRRTSPS